MKKLALIFLLALVSCEKDIAPIGHEVTVFDESGWYWYNIVIQVNDDQFDITPIQFINGYKIPVMVPRSGFMLKLQRPGDVLRTISIDDITSECHVFVDFNGSTFSFRFVYKNNW